MKYNVYIQDQLYKAMEAKNTGDVLAQVAKDIQNNDVYFYDKKKDANIRLEPIASWNK